MSWIKLNFIEYDISNIQTGGFFISKRTKCIKDVNLNNIITVPFLINGHYDLYKVELEVKNTVLIIYVYINYYNLVDYITSIKEIPCRNELFEVLKKNRGTFKFNRTIFDSLDLNIQKYPGDSDKFISNIFNNNNIIKALSDDCILYRNLCIDLEMQTFSYNTNKYNLVKPLTNILYQCPDDIGQTINRILDMSDNKRTLIISNHLNVNKYIENRNAINITLLNYNKIKLCDIINTKLIIIDYKVIKNRNYYNPYKKFHSSGNQDKAYFNYKQYIDAIINRGGILNQKFYNVEIIKFDNILCIDMLDQSFLSTNNYTFFNNKLVYSNRLYLQNILNVDFTYCYYSGVRPYLFESLRNLEDYNVNKVFIEKNVYFNFNQYFDIIQTTPQIHNGNNKLIRMDFIDDNIEHYSDICMFETILNKKHIKYDIEITDRQDEFKCPITYDCSQSIKVTCACRHQFSFNGFINHLFYSRLCPLCQKCLFNSRIEISGSQEDIMILMYGNTVKSHIKQNCYNLFLVNSIINSDILNDRLDTMKQSLKHKPDIRFFCLDNSEVFTDMGLNISNKCICIHIYEQFTIFERYKAIKLISGRLKNKKLFLNII